MNWTVAKILEATGGTLLQGRPDQSLAGISTDTRQIRPSDCFVALVGERTDGHEFLPEALTKGAGALVIARSRVTPALIAPAETAVVAVPDTLYALGNWPLLAAAFTRWWLSPAAMAKLRPRKWWRRYSARIGRSSKPRAISTT